MNNTYVTIRGWIGGEPKLFSNNDTKSEGEATRATTIFRVGVTPRYFNRHEGRYTDGVTTWYAVRCYGALATNASLSLKKGMPVIVRGRLVTRLWNDRDQVQQRELSIIADSVGVELSNGIVNYVRRADMTLPPQPGEPGWAGDDSVAEARTKPEEGWNGTGSHGTDTDAGEPAVVVDEDGVLIEHGPETESEYSEPSEREEAFA
ncbi:single-strand DNA-binding protein [Trueperella bonasi]|uniref:Single-strand DNA-binding protein n=1 Tax=Trueperella bonasi TaxID=312286 RepID=A0ABT9NHJ0_9ACTO|nr:single-stranded DNA-binding protein [Trueperella bonasi]MDP9806869.1 single-strand DNA-binding protein [Trueperella bonasi]